MELTTIAKPYASAIFTLAKDSNSFNNWTAVLDAMAQLANNDNMQDFIISPNITKEKKIDFISKLIKSILNRDLAIEEKNFILLILKNGRFNILPSIFKLLTKLVNESSDTKSFQIISAYKLSKDEEKKIKKDLTDKYNTKVTIDTLVDENLIGGIVVKHGDKVVDISVKARVDELGLHLRAANLF